MTRALALLVFAPLALAACQQNATAPMPSGGSSAGAMGESYCESPPADPADQSTWEQLCMPDRG
jgi:hypothetical protein